MTPQQEPELSPEEQAKAEWRDYLEKVAKILAHQREKANRQRMAIAVLKNQRREMRKNPLLLVRRMMRANTRDDRGPVDET